MRGLVRPCRHQLTPALRERWRAHLCGLCLTLRAESGQPARLLTGYDVLLLSVLVEAQTGMLPTTTAGPCALRGMRTAEVVRADTPAMQLAAAGTLLTGAAGLADKVLDGDLPAGTRMAARSAGRRFAADGRRVAAGVGVDADAISATAGAALAVEADVTADLDALLAPSGRTVGELFAATAVTASQPENAPALRRAGDAFGRLVHLADAIDDVDDDRRRGHFNPLTATGTSPEDAAARARTLHTEITSALSQVDMADRELADALFGPVLGKTVRRWRTADPVCAPAAVPRPRAPLATAFAGLSAVTVLGIFGGRPPRRRGGMFGGGGYYPNYDPRFDARYGRQYRRGPSCCDLLACDCCANLACDDCCGGDDCCVCCC